MKNRLVYIVCAVVLGCLIGAGYVLQNQIETLSRQNAALQHRVSTPAKSGSGSQKAPVHPFVQNQVKNTIVKNARSLQICYNKFIDASGKDDGTKTDGKVHIEWQISAGGIPNKVAKISSEIPDKDLTQCIERAISTWEFPTPPYEDFYISHYFTFKKAEV
jgi:hypothetical protein